MKKRRKVETKSIFESSYFNILTGFNCETIFDSPLFLFVEGAAIIGLPNPSSEIEEP